MTDHDEITQLLARYARAVDTKDWDLYRSVFTTDARIDYTSAGGESGDLDHVVAWMQKTFDGLVLWSMHYITNIEITVHTYERASVHAAFYNPMEFKGIGGPSFFGGRYYHRLERSAATANQWRSAHLTEQSVFAHDKPSGGL